MKNLFDQIPTTIPEEVFETLVKTPGLHIKRILSQGQTTDWYNQEEHEWVMIVQGEAHLRIEGEEKPHKLSRGDYLEIPSRTRHRVEWTHPEETTIWLAIHHKAETV
ncbi:MAG: cupin domain-containing protein [Planctomycetota bacterium]|jgi:cupin 2 domain-containing protein|nr:cupin domain-containing protein [Planctomycetota bacterium]